MKAEPAEKRAMLAWLWRSYLSKRKGSMALAFVLMACEGSMLGALSYMIEPMFDRVFIAGDRGAVIWVAAGVMGVFLVRALSAFGSRLLIKNVGLRVSAALQGDMVRHILTLDSAWFQVNPPGTLIERVKGDTGVAANMWAVGFSALGRDIVALLSLLAVAISIDWVWTLVAVAGAPALVGPILLLQRWIRRSARAARVAAAGVVTRLDESFHGIDTIKLNAIERRESGRVDDSIEGLVKQEMRAEVGMAGIPGLTDVVAGVGFFGVLIYGGYQIIDGAKTVGEFMSFFTAMALVFDPLRRLGNLSGAWQAALASLERIDAIFEARPTIASPTRPAKLELRAELADVKLEDVTFAYAGNPALRGAAFTAEAGKTTALVGASGAGKSTVFRMLTRLANPQSGRILVGGVDASTLALEELRSLFSVVTQDAQMFDDTVRDNILFGREDMADARLEEVLRAAHVADFLPRLSCGLDTQAGPRGSALSGGQRQRVAIARALMRDAPVLLLDEATSSLDSQSERLVQEALERLSEGRTTLVIAHRLATIREAQKIVVMDQGRVVDQGSHAELISRGGLYAELHRLQFESG